jgi:biotin transport system permease protein
MAQTLIFHYRESNNFLAKAHPMVKLLGLLALCIPLVSASFYGIILILFSVVVTSIIIKMPLYHYLKELTFLIIIASVIAISTYISSKNMMTSVSSTLKFSTAVYASLVLADTTDPSDLARALGSFLNHIPFVNGWVVASQIELTISILPLIFDTSASISEARLSRGENALYHPIKAMIGLVYNIMDLLLENVDEMAYALDSRGFDPYLEQASIKYKPHDVVLLLVIVMISFGGYVL